MDMGIYPLQAARYVTGLEPLTVSAQCFNTRPEILKNLYDVYSFQLEFPGGAVANLDTGFHANFNYLKAFTENGWFELDPFSSYGGIKGRSVKGEFSFPNINQQAQQMDEDALSFSKGETPRVTGYEGLKDLLVIEAVNESIKTGKKVNIGKV